jgi:hypothetical protein
MVKGLYGVVGCPLAISAAEAAEKCPFKPIPAAEMPGLALDSLYQDVKARIPKSAKCDDIEQLYCSYVDQYAYEITFSEVTEMRLGKGPDRLHYLKTAARERGGKLPFGVLWSDSQAQVMKKVHALGATPKAGREDGRPIIRVLGCFAPGLGDPYSTEFTFTPQGRLAWVSQSTLWP